MSIKLRLSILLFFFVISVTQGQKVIESNSGSPFELINLERQQFKFNFLSPGFTYEFALFKNVTVSSSVGLGAATYEEGYAFGLVLNNRARYYYNLNARANKGKNVSGNSGNYVSAAQAIFFSQLRLATNIEGPSDFNIGFFGVVHGIQRTYPKGFNFNAEIGAGYYKGDGVFSGYGPLINLNFGWVATKRRSRKPTFN